MYLPSIVIVGYYFDKKRAFATGLATCGSGEHSDKCDLSLKYPNSNHLEMLSNGHNVLLVLNLWRF